MINLSFIQSHSHIHQNVGLSLSDEEQEPQSSSKTSIRSTIEGTDNIDTSMEENETHQLLNDQSSMLQFLEDVSTQSMATWCSQAIEPMKQRMEVIEEHKRVLRENERECDRQQKAANALLDSCKQHLALFHSCFSLNVIHVFCIAFFITYYFKCMS